jgi:hypothetical protein
MSSNGSRYDSGEFSEELYEATNALKISFTHNQQVNVNFVSVASSQVVKIKLLYTFSQGTTEIIVDGIQNLIHMYRTIKKLVRFCDDETNIYFVRALCSGRTNVLLMPGNFSSAEM